MNTHCRPARLRSQVASLVCFCLLATLAGCRRDPDAPASNAPATPVATLSPQQPAAGACGVPYYPVGPGTQRQYRVTYKTGGLPASTYTESYADIKPDSFTLRQTFPQLSVDTGWNCTPEGMLALEYGKLDFAQKSAGFKMETINRTGVTVPSAARWRVGESWESRYEIRAELTTAAAGAPRGTGSGTIEIKNRIVGQESVTSPAGTFQALKVEMTFRMKLSVSVGKVTVPSETSHKSTAWFAEGVGMVRSETSGDFGGATTELISFKQ